MPLVTEWNGVLQECALSAYLYVVIYADNQVSCTGFTSEQHSLERSARPWILLHTENAWRVEEAASKFSNCFITSKRVCVHLLLSSEHVLPIAGTMLPAWPSWLADRGRRRINRPEKFRKNGEKIRCMLEHEHH